MSKHKKKKKKKAGFFDFLKSKHKKPIYKGFINGVPEAGIHGHTLIRELKTTRQDGRHVHLYLIQGHSLLTDVDGSHTHGMVRENADKVTSQGSTHRHRIEIPFDITLNDGTILIKGTEIFTQLDGDHDHSSLIETTAFDGLHDHILVLPDDARLRSYRAGEFWDWIGSPQQDGLPDFPSSPEITQAVDVFTSSLFKESEIGDNDSVSRGGVDEKTTDTNNGLDDERLLQKEDAISSDRLLALAALGYDVKVVGKQNAEDAANTLASVNIEEEIAKAEKLVPEEILICKQDEELRLAYGVVLTPEFRDGENDIISKEEIRKAAHFFMLKSRVIGFRHRKKSKAKLVENYLASQDLTFKGQNGTQKVPEGSWIIGIWVPDDQEWADIKSGKINAFSPGGFSRKIPG